MRFFSPRPLNDPKMKKTKVNVVPEMRKRSENFSSGSDSPRRSDSPIVKQAKKSLGLKNRLRNQ